MPISSHPASPQRSPGSSNLRLHHLMPDSAKAAIKAGKELLLEYGRFVAAQPGVTHFCYGDLEQEAASLPHSYIEQSGGSIVASAPDTAAKWIGFIAWRTLPAPELEDAWELKRLWVPPQGRGSGVGRILVQAVEDRARAAGKSRLVLDTAPESMSAAHRLYLELGFTECPPYLSEAPIGIVYMTKRV